MVEWWIIVRKQYMNQDIEVRKSQFQSHLANLNREIKVRKFRLQSHLMYFIFKMYRKPILKNNRKPILKNKRKLILKNKQKPILKSNMERLRHQPQLDGPLKLLNKYRMMINILNLISYFDDV